MEHKDERLSWEERPAAFSKIFAGMVILTVPQMVAPVTSPMLQRSRIDSRKASPMRLEAKNGSETLVLQDRNPNVWVDKQIRRCEVLSGFQGPGTVRTIRGVGCRRYLVRKVGLQIATKMSSEMPASSGEFVGG